MTTLQLSGIAGSNSVLQVGGPYAMLYWKSIDWDHFPLPVAINTGGIPSGWFYVRDTGVYLFKAQIYIEPPQAPCSMSLYLSLNNNAGSVLRVANTVFEAGQHPSLAVDALIKHDATNGGAYYGFFSRALDGTGNTSTLNLQQSGTYCWSSVEMVG